MIDDSKLTDCVLSATAEYLIPLFNLCQTMSGVYVYVCLWHLCRPVFAFKLVQSCVCGALETRSVYIL